VLENVQEESAKPSREGAYGCGSKEGAKGQETGSRMVSGGPGGGGSPAASEAPHGKKEEKMQRAYLKGGNGGPEGKS